MAIRLLEQDAYAKEFVLNTTIPEQVQNLLQGLHESLQEDCDIVLADQRYQMIAEITAHCVQNKKTGRKTTTEIIDKLVMNRWLGIPIFLLIMYLMFEFSMNVGTLLQPFFNISSTTIFVNGVGY